MFTIHAKSVSGSKWEKDQQGVNGEDWRIYRYIYIDIYYIYSILLYFPPSPNVHQHSPKFTKSHQRTHPNKVINRHQWQAYRGNLSPFRDTHLGQSLTANPHHRGNY